MTLYLSAVNCHMKSRCVTCNPP